MINKTLASLGVGLSVLLGIAVAVPAFAQTTNTPPTPTNDSQDRGMMGGPGRDNETGPGMMKPGVFGTVSAINGTSLTVAGKTRPTRATDGTMSAPTTVTYTVDASNATVDKSGAASTLSAIAVGDTVMIQGTVTGTNIVATVIRDGVMPHTPGTQGKGGAGEGKGRMGSSTPQMPAITGNGQPVVAGTISTLNGTSFTITTSSNVTYTIDATSAKIVQGKDTITTSGLTVGDSVIVQGTINGTSVTASSVIDQKAPSTSNGNTDSGSTQHPGMFGGIGQFFRHLFGF
jgi:hypothetical protein